jgi:hypothetical protein
MTDGRIRGTLAAKRNASPRLSLEDVLNAGLPAVYRDHGEHLLFRDGRIFDGSRVGAAAVEPLIVLGSGHEAVGLEFGWRHVAGCSCSLCRNDHPSFADAPQVWRAEQATA